MKDPVEIIENHIENTGSTYYIPDNREISYLEGAVKRNVLVRRNGKYTLPLIDKQEQSIAKYAIARLHYDVSKKEEKEEKINLFISLYEEIEGIKLDEWQKVAVHIALRENLFVLTGGPGTGKTCVLKCIRFCLRKILKTEDILFTAPTGKAARRITESVGVPAFTVAKILGLVDEKSKARSISSKVMIVDEISMLDTYTAEALFRAVALSTKLILVGDVEQLPSVGYGSVLRDLIDAGIPCIKLEKTFRQASESGIFANIEQIKAGLNMGFIERPDFKILKAENTLDAKDIMIKEYLDATKIYGVDNVVCLTPFRRKGDVCAIRINEEIQKIVNPPKSQNSICFQVNEEDGFSYTLRFVEGDPVMQLVNQKLVANGDVGKIKSIDSKNNTVFVEYIDCEVAYEKEELGQLCLAYAMSVHKSQGSEYACVITSALNADFDMLSRNTIYTAVTRAKKECRIITEKNSDVAQRACQIESGYERLTNLCQAIETEEKRYQLLKTL